MERNEFIEDVVSAAQSGEQPRPGWEQDAYCYINGMDQDQFYLAGTMRREIARACGGCAVRRDCVLSEMYVTNKLDIHGHQGGLAQKVKRGMYMRVNVHKQRG